MISEYIMFRDFTITNCSKVARIGNNSILGYEVIICPIGTKELFLSKTKRY